MKQKSFGILNQTINADEIERHVEALTIDGFAVVENVLDEKELNTAKNKIENVYASQVAEFSQEELASINELFMARLPLAYDDYFIGLLSKEPVISIVRKILGNYFILHLQNGIINMPKQEHHQSSWHRDIPYHDFIISKPLAISALFCLDDFNESTGGTLVIPFSHRLDRMPSEEYVESRAKQVVASKGSVIMFDSMLFHKAGYNSSDQVRRGINHMFTSAIMKQQINIPESLKGKFNSDPFLKMLLGYESTVKESVFEWRKNRLKK